MLALYPFLLAYSLQTIRQFKKQRKKYHNASVYRRALKKKNKVGWFGFYLPKLSNPAGLPNTQPKVINKRKTTHPLPHIFQFI